MWLFCSIKSLTLMEDNQADIGKVPDTHLDVFMAIFMVCALEVVVLKILTFEEELDRRRRSTDLYYENDDEQY